MKKIFFLYTCLLFVQTTTAQGRIVFHALNVGDSIVADISINTNKIYQKGNSNIPVETRLVLKKIFYVQAISEQGYTILVTTIDIRDSLTAVGQKRFYKAALENSALDNNSVITGAMYKLLSGTDTLQVDRYGIITHIKNSRTFNKELLPIIADLIPAPYSPGTSIGFFSSFSVPEYKDAAKWKDFRENTEGSITTDCNIFSITDTALVIRFTQSLKGKYENKNANGMESISRQTGVVSERLIQSRSSAYEILKEVLVFVNKSQAINESYTIIPSKYN